MQRQTLSIIAVLAGLLSASQADAAANKTGWGVSATVGSSRIKDQDGSESFSGNGVGFSAEFEYRFTRHFALGFGGFSLGETDDLFNSVNTEISVRGYDIFARAILPVSDTVDIYGRIAAANYFVDIEPGSVSLSDALFGDDAFELGVGIDFGRKQNLAFRLEGRFFNGGDDETGTMLMLGVNYLF